MLRNLPMGELTTEMIRKTNEAKNFDDIEDGMWMAGDLLR